MTRQDHLPRLSDWHIRAKDPSYIHYYYLIRDIREALDKYARGNFLDLGCGNKPYESLYNPKTEKQTGCDVQQSDGNRVDVICPATDLKFEANTFDSILCTQVLEHVYDHHGMMKEVHRVLKPGGHIILTVPFVWELHEEPYDFFRYTRYGAQYLLEQAGFEPAAFVPIGGLWSRVGLTMIAGLNRVNRGPTRLLTELPVRLLYTVIQTLARLMDVLFGDEREVLAHLVVARRRP